MSINKKTIFLPNEEASSAYLALVNVVAAAAVISRNVEDNPVQGSYGNKYPYALVQIEGQRSTLRGSILFNMDSLRVEEDDKSVEFNDFMLTVEFNNSEDFYNTHDDLYLSAYDEVRADYQQHKMDFPNGFPHSPILKNNMQQLMFLIKSADINGLSILRTTSVFDRGRTTSFVFGEGCLFLQAMLKTIASVTDSYSSYSVTKERKAIGTFPKDPVIDLFMLTHKGKQQ